VAESIERARAYIVLYIARAHPYSADRMWRLDLTKAGLAARERQVLDSMARYGSAKGMGEALGLSHETVRVHMKKIYQKLHVQSKSEALAVLAQETRI
jgi:DNA-binding CsgD family transcriptional regulator